TEDAEAIAIAIADMERDRFIGCDSWLVETPGREPAAACRAGSPKGATPPGTRTVRHAGRSSRPSATRPPLRSQSRRRPARNAGIARAARAARGVLKVRTTRGCATRATVPAAPLCYPRGAGAAGAAGRSDGGSARIDREPARDGQEWRRSGARAPVRAVPADADALGARTPAAAGARARRNLRSGPGHADPGARPDR